MLKTILGTLVFGVLTLLTASTAQRGCQDATRSATHLTYYPVRDMRTTVAIAPQKVVLLAPDSGSVPFGGMELPPTDAGGRPLTGLDLTKHLAETLTNPVAADDSSIARGGRKYQRTCLPCHGTGMKGDGPVAARFMPPPDLLGASARGRADGFIYSYIRNGGAVMPSYGAQVTAREAWDVVNYLRHMQRTSPR
jgi:mono/diheme cytochrome c family protein